MSRLEQEMAYLVRLGAREVSVRWLADRVEASALFDTWRTGNGKTGEDALEDIAEKVRGAR